MLNKKVSLMLIFSLFIWPNVSNAGFVKDQIAKMKARSETQAYDIAKERIKDAIPEKKFPSCGYQLSLPKPKTYGLPYDDLNRLFSILYPGEGFEIVGFFDPKTNTVYYENGRWDTLVHEYVHFFNNNGVNNQHVSFHCVDELAANGIGDLYAIEDKIRRLEDKIRELRKKTR
jgi:hypothetical protein